MACLCAPALRRLQSEITDKWPKRDKASDGCCGDAAHAARKSDHNPVDGYAHAVDIDENLSPDIDSLMFLIPTLLADSRTKYVIYEGRIYYPPSTVKTYTGVNAHKQHLHVSIKTTATFETRSWLGDVEKPEPPQEDDMPLNDDDKKWIHDEMVSVIVGLGVAGAADPRNAAVTAIVGEVRKVPGWVAESASPVEVDGGLTAEEFADELAERLRD